MKEICLAVLLGALAGSISSGCRGQPEPPPEAAYSDAAEENGAAQSSSEGIRAAQGLIEAGQVDAAAARLAQMQLQAATFNAEQARDYRQTYTEAYDRALEAIQRGDPRGEAALRLLRAAAPR